MIIASELLLKIRDEYPLDPSGLHGLNHWARVREFGLHLCRSTGADPVVVELFSIFHDCQRRNESLDPGHGPRGAAMAQKLHGRYFTASRDQLDLLCRACHGHTSGSIGETEDITVRTCWDADRLDLLRAGITPNPRYLCTPAARDPEVISWASGLAKVRAATRTLCRWEGMLEPERFVAHMAEQDFAGA